MQNKLRIIRSYLKYRTPKRFKSKEALLKYQKTCVHKLLRHLKKHSPYYGRKLSENSDFHSLPIMEKSLMMEHFDELVCANVKKEEALNFGIDSEKGRNFDRTLHGYTVGLSSGTSGHQGIFIATQEEADLWVGAILGRFLPNGIGTQRIAFFLRANSTLYENAKTGKIEFTYYDIYRPFKEHIEKLNQTPPTILIAPPSVLILLADAVQSGSLSLNPQKVISVAEVLEKKEEEYFKKAFQQKIIHQVYQCTEGFLGYTCEYGTCLLYTSPSPRDCS